MWNLKLFNKYTLCSQETSYFFNVGFEDFFSIYILCSREKNYVFSILDKKKFDLNTST